MSEVKHTASPWHVGMLGDVNNVYDSEGRQIANTTLSRLLGRGEKAANARLIAAAPDMLEALHEIAKRWPDSSAAKTARAAIAKAEGRS